MELNEPIPHEAITLNGEPCFCAEGNRLALDYLQAARDALINLPYSRKTAIHFRSDMQTVALLARYHRLSV
jgi:hypothetical protein